MGEADCSDQRKGIRSWQVDGDEEMSGAGTGREDAEAEAVDAGD